tara:strand:+ start:22673 stop:23365 length:693 start_codon:yes stop_codon:yes gene_type:complete
LSLILNIETSTKTCSISIAENGNLFAYEEIKSDQFVHGEKLHQMIKDLFDKNKKNITEISAVAVASGPGSFTGLRIGVSAAKGLAYGLKVPLISIMTINLMIEYYDVKRKIENIIIFPMIDARRNEVYTAGYNFKKKMILPVNAQIINDEFLTSLKKYEEIYFVGEGAEKLYGKINQANLSIEAFHLNSAKAMVKLSYNKFIKNQFEDIAYFNPYYLKDFIPHKKNLTPT